MTAGSLPCLMRRPPGRNPNDESRKSASKIGSNTSITAICTTRSLTVGMPSGRCRPSGLGMYTRFTGLRPIGLRPQFFLQVPQEAFDTAGLVQHVLTRTPSTPAAPSFLQHQLPCRFEHVEPIDPVIQGVKPEIAAPAWPSAQFSLSSETFRGNGTPDFTSGGARWRWASSRFVRSGIVVQADLLALLMKTRCRQRAFAPRALPASSLLCPPPTPVRPVGGYAFPPQVSELSPEFFASGSGLSGSCWVFPCPPSPITPESPPLLCSLLHGRYQASPIRRVGHSHFCHEAGTGSRLRLRLTWPLSRLHPTDHSAGRWVASWRTSNSHDQYLSTG